MKHIRIADLDIELREIQFKIRNNPEQQMDSYQLSYWFVFIVMMKVHLQILKYTVAMSSAFRTKILYQILRHFNELINHLTLPLEFYHNLHNWMTNR